jgi:hypothetical protein
LADEELRMLVLEMERSNAAMGGSANCVKVLGVEGF